MTRRILAALQRELGIDEHTLALLVGVDEAELLGWRAGAARPGEWMRNILTFAGIGVLDGRAVGKAKTLIKKGHHVSAFVALVAGAVDLKR